MSDSELYLEGEEWLEEEIGLSSIRGFSDEVKGFVCARCGGAHYTVKVITSPVGAFLSLTCPFCGNEVQHMMEVDDGDRRN